MDHRGHQDLSTLVCWTTVIGDPGRRHCRVLGALLIATTVVGASRRRRMPRLGRIIRNNGARRATTCTEIRRRGTRFGRTLCK